MMEFVSSYKGGPQGLKPSPFAPFTARLKSCPDTKRLDRSIHGPKAQGHEQHSLSSNRFPWKRFPSLCHPERSRGICGSADPSWKCFFEICGFTRALESPTRVTKR